MSLEFEWDARKAFENLKRHRINFDQASGVFDDPDAFETFDDSQDYGEDRFTRVGMSGGKLLSVTYTNLPDVVASYPHVKRARMKKKTIVTRLGADGKLRRVNPDGTLTLLRVKPIPELPDDFVEAAARADPDNPPLTQERLARFHRVPRVKTLRWNIGLSQEEFAKHYAIPLGTLRDWERGRTEPDPAARAYLEVIAHDPERVREILHEAQRKPSSRAHRRRARVSA